MAGPQPASRTVTAALAVGLVLLAIPIGPHASSASPSPATAPSPKLTAASAVLQDFDTGRVLYSRAPTARRPIASLTKIMTAVVVLSSSNLDDVVAVPSAAVSQPGSTLDLHVGERLTVRHLLFGMLMTSANDAAVALAYHVGGSVALFVRMMNATAERMGLRDSHFASATGLDDTGYSTAEDLAVLTRKAYRNTTFAQAVATVRKRLAGPAGTTRRLVNANILLRVYPGAFGVKSGFTTAAGHCLAGAARLNGFGLLAVVLGSPTNAFDDTIHLLNYGFGAYERIAVVSKGDIVGRVTLNGTPFDAVAATDVFVVVGRTGRPRVDTRFVPMNDISGPTIAGTRIGRVEVRLGGHLVEVVPAVATPVVPIPQRPVSGPRRLTAVERAILFLVDLIRAALNAFL